MLKNCYTIAVLTAKEGKIDDLLRTLTDLAEATRKEPGCIEYGFYQETENSNTVLSFERWVDVEAESAHWNTEHLTNALADLDSILESKPSVYKTTKTI